MMKMNYFRFLYCETKSCLVHFSEVKDTKKDETFTVLYIRGEEEPVNQTESDHKLFLYPEYVDLVVLGRMDGKAAAVLKGLLTGTKVGTLVLPAGAELQDEAQLTGEKLLNTAQQKEVSCLSEEMLERVEQVVYLADTAGMIQSDGQNQSADRFERKAAGWKFLVKCWTKGALAMVHMLDEVNGQTPFNDCVMNIKAVDGEQRCSKEEHPDGYGCALGCVLHQDYDVCKYRNEGETSPYLTGTLLISGRGSDAEREAFVNEIGQTENIRFFVSEDSDETILERLLPDAEETKEGPKRYYIGTKLNDETVARVCRSGFNRIPVMLREGRGICCSGLLKYAEAE